MKISDILTLMAAKSGGSYSANLDGRDVPVQSVKVKPYVEGKGAHIEVVATLTVDEKPYVIDGRYRLKDGHDEGLTVNGEEIAEGMGQIDFHLSLRGIPPHVTASYHFQWSDTQAVHRCRVSWERSLLR